MIFKHVNHQENPSKFILKIILEYLFWASESETDRDFVRVEYTRVPPTVTSVQSLSR